MDVKLRVLLIEDSEDDALLLVRTLRRGGYDTTWERVDTAADMEAALDGRSWDLVISDHSMPAFSSSAALGLLRSKGFVDLPFIIVSGQIGEDAAVAAMKAGAHDYLMKDNLARLNSAIERELREAGVRRERRRAQVALGASETRFRMMVEQSPLSTQIFSPDGRTLRVNRAWEELWGVRLDQIPGYNVLRDPQLVEKGIMPYIERAFAGEATAVPPVRYEPGASIPNVSHVAHRWVQASSTRKGRRRQDPGGRARPRGHHREEGGRGEVPHHLRERRRGDLPDDDRGEFPDGHPRDGPHARLRVPREVLETISNIGGQLYVEPERREEVYRLALRDGFVSGFEVEMLRKDGSHVGSPSTRAPSTTPGAGSRATRAL